MEAKSDDSDETVSQNNALRSKMHDFGRDCLQKQSAELQKQRFRATLSRNTSLETAKVTISDETVKKTKQKEGRRRSTSTGFERDCPQKHEIT